MPDTVRAAIRVGYRRLSKEAQAFLAAASVLDERFEPEDVIRVLELEPERAANAIDELEWSRWLEAEPRGYGFVARIVRAVISEDMLTPGQRRRYLDRLTNS